MHQYQILVRSSNWIVTLTQTNLTPLVAFLSSYNHSPSLEHLKVELYSFCYVHSPPYLGITFSYVEATDPHSQIYFPFYHYKDAYICASVTTPTSQN